MLLVVGLGNPGVKYKNTPHNAGFQACDRLVERHSLGKPSARFQGEFWRGRVAGHDVGVLKPQTYMNLSGHSVSEALRYLPAEPEDVIVIYDEMDIAEGRLRIRKKGGAGGHNGLKSICEQLSTKDFPRIRIGIGRPPKGRDATGHLLNRVRKSENERFEKTVDLAVEALECLLSNGIDEAMNRYNAVAIEESQEGTQ